MRVFQSLKAKIILLFVVLLGMGMLLVNAVAFMLWRQQALQAEIEYSRSMLAMASRMAEKLGVPGEAALERAGPQALADPDGGPVCFARRMAAGAAITPSGCGEVSQSLAAGLSEAMGTRSEVIRFVKTEKENSAPGKNGLLVAVPLRQGQEVLGAVGMVRSLAPLYRRFWGNEKIILVYILANLFILTVVWSLRMLKLFFRPIESLAAEAERYPRQSIFLPLVRGQSNELGRLGSSLQHMFAQIEDDREKLRQTVRALEQANRELAETRQGMVHTEKMASIGRLSAGLAHEIGNPLGIAQGYLELLGQPGMEGKKRRQYCERAERELGRVNRLLRLLLDFARPSVGARSRFVLQQLLEQTVEMFRNRKKGADPIDYVLDLAAQDDLVDADPDGVQQVVVNCLLNAEDAILAKAHRTTAGKIVVSCRNEYTASGKTVILVTIQDNGEGIAAENLENIFDPFFTTKEPGKGTGLGLSVSYGIIMSFDGAMWATSEPGKGATIWIKLPVVGD